MGWQCTDYLVWTTLGISVSQVDEGAAADGQMGKSRLASRCDRDFPELPEYLGLPRDFEDRLHTFGICVYLQRNSGSLT